jgi:drug/metabolite transporter (DMT)-like permease
MNPIFGQLFALLTAMCWAQNSIVYSAAGKRVSSGTVTHIRLWIALPAILLVHLIATRGLIPVNMTSASAGYLAASGLIGFFIADLLIFRGFVDLGPRETLVILTLSPIFAALISWLTLAETLSVVQIAGIVGTTTGVMWVVWVERRAPEKQTRDYKTGVLFAFLGALAQAGGMVLSKQGLADGAHPISANVIRIGAGFAGLVVYSMVRGRLLIDFRKMRDRRALALIAAGALVGPVAGIIFTLYALTLAPVGIVTAIMQTSPILLLPVDRFVFKKKIPVSVIGGTLLAVAGTVLLFLY